MFENLFRLDGKIAVVTGAGNGLGRSIALGLAASSAVANIAVTPIGRKRAIAVLRSGSW